MKERKRQREGWRGRNRNETVLGIQNSRDRPCVDKTMCHTWTNQCQIKSPFSAHVMFAVKRVHKHGQQVCGNQNHFSFADRTPLRKNIGLQDAAARVIVSSMIDLILRPVPTPLTFRTFPKPPSQLRSLCPHTAPKDEPETQNWPEEA